MREAGKDEEAGAKLVKAEGYLTDAETKFDETTKTLGKAVAQYNAAKDAADAANKALANSENLLDGAIKSGHIPRM